MLLLEAAIWNVVRAAWSGLRWVVFVVGAKRIRSEKGTVEIVPRVPRVRVGASFIEQ